MSDWQYRIDLTGVWDKWPDEVSTQELSKIIATKLRELDCPELEEIWDERFLIADEFEIIANDPMPDLDDFNSQMDELFDWGDTSFDYNDVNKKVCWIATLF